MDMFRRKGSEGETPAGPTHEDGGVSNKVDFAGKKEG